jgi:nicotinamidase-related amidase
LADLATSLYSLVVPDDLASYPIIHLAIDVQDDYTKLLSPKRAKKFKQRANEFANSLRKLGIPTIWAAWGTLDSFRCYAQDITSYPSDIHPLSQGTLSDLTLTSISLGKNDFVFAKGDDNAFANPLLATLLKKLQTHTIIISGMSTGVCVMRTIKGARSVGCPTPPARSGHPCRRCRCR